jgi:hypothetical protein
MRYIYRQRRRMLQVSRENYTILTKNVGFAQQKLKSVFADQFNKLRNYFVTAEILS